MKKFFAYPELKLITFEMADVIATSTPVPGGEGDDVIPEDD